MVAKNDRAFLTPVLEYGMLQTNGFAFMLLCWFFFFLIQRLRLQQVKIKATWAIQVIAEIV